MLDKILIIKISGQFKLHFPQDLVLDPGHEDEAADQEEEPGGRQLHPNQVEAPD